MAADLRLVLHAAQRQAHELAAQRARDRLAERGLAHAGRPDEAEQRALHLVLQLAHREVLDDALLDLLQAVVVLVEDPLRLREVEVVLALLAPGQPDHPVQPVAQGRRLRGVGVHALQLLELALDLLQDRLRHPGLVGLLLERRDLLRQLVAFAQLALDRLQLLAQEELALAPVHLALGLGRDLLLHGQDLELLGHQLVDPAQALDGVGGLQDLLRPFDLEVEVARGEVGQAPRLLHVGGDDDDLGGDGLAEVGRLLERRLDVAHQGLDLEVLVRGLRLRDRLDAGVEVRMAFLEGHDARAPDALHQHADAAVGQLQHAHDEGHRADAEDVVRPRVLVVLALLGREQDHPVVGEGLVHGLDGAVAAHVQRHDHEGEDHDVPEGEDGEDLGDLDRLVVLAQFVGHEVSSRWTGMMISRPRRSLTLGIVTVNTPPARCDSTCWMSTATSMRMVRVKRPWGRSTQ